MMVAIKGENFYKCPTSGGRGGLSETLQHIFHKWEVS